MKKGIMEEQEEKGRGVIAFMFLRGGERCLDGDCWTLNGLPRRNRERKKVEAKVASSVLAAAVAERSSNASSATINISKSGEILQVVGLKWQLLTQAKDSSM